MTKIRRKRKLTKRWMFLREFLNLPRATGADEAKWEGYQAAFLNDDAMFSITNKSRQVGWSFTAALEAVADCHIIPGHTAIFQSINQAESNEKTRYANAIHEALHPGVRLTKIMDNRQEIEFNNGSRIVSHSSRPTRGKARATLYLDEFAWYQHADDVYTAGIPVTTHGGRIRIGSTPAGAQGKFWEIYTKYGGKYQGYSRHFVPWWHSLRLCNDLLGAAKNCNKMTTEERVMTYGTPRLIEIYQNVPVDDFKQEYEGEWLDDTLAWISWDEIYQAQGRQPEKFHYTANNPADAVRVCTWLWRHMVAEKIEDDFVLGIDVGRVKDATEFSLFGVRPDGFMTQRLQVTLKGTPFDDQIYVARGIMEKLPVSTGYIDRNGLGMQMAETLEAEFPWRLMGFNFTMQSKKDLATELKLRFQRGTITLQPDRDTAYQIHSLKKKVTNAGNVVFDIEQNSEHHGDKAWAVALAAFAAEDQQIQEAEISTSLMHGYRG